MDFRMLRYVVCQTLIASSFVTIFAMFYVAFNPPDDRPTWARSEAGFNAHFVGR